MSGSDRLSVSPSGSPCRHSGRKGGFDGEGLGGGRLRTGPHL